MKRLDLLTTFALACAVIAPARALDIGLEGTLRLESSDNIGAANAGEESNGQIGFMTFGVFGEQRGNLLQAGFSGEFEATRVVSDPDDEPTTLNNFFGAANLQLSPSLTWYFGDVLGSVRTGDGVLAVNGEETARRNVFVTGPAFNAEFGTSSSVSAQTLYFHQTQQDRELEQLLSAEFVWQYDLGGGNSYGLDLNNIYTDEADEPDNPDAIADNNRFSASVFWDRQQPRWGLNTSLGGTRYDVEDTTVSGLNAQLQLTRRLGPQTSLNFAIGTDLSDEAIATIDTLLEDGEGVEPEVDGIFQSNTASLSYATVRLGTGIDVGVRFEDAQYKLIGSSASNVELEDNRSAAIFGNISKQFSRRLSADFGVEASRQTFANRDDEVDAISANAFVGYYLNRSFELGIGWGVASNSGIDTRNVEGGGVETIDSLENRVSLQLLWAPPTRATKETVVQLKQLLR